MIKKKMYDMDTQLTFQPDYTPMRKLVLELIRFFAFAVICGWLFFLLNGSPQTTIIALVADSAFMLCMAFVLLIIVFCVAARCVREHNFKNLKYLVNREGMSLVFSEVTLLKIPWNEVYDIIAYHGPCEPVYEQVSGPYGVYVCMKPNCVAHIDQMSATILNLNFSSHHPEEVVNYKIIRIYTSSSYGKCKDLEAHLRKWKSSYLHVQCNPFDTNQT